MNTQTQCNLFTPSSNRYDVPLTYSLSKLPERIQKFIKVEKDCWVWQGATYLGYGRLRHRNFKTCKAHRIVYQLLCGNIPDNLTIDHLCRNRSCVNPAHLEPVDFLENLRRGTGVGVVNAAKTHCARGHEYTGRNTYFDRLNNRHCRTCGIAATARWKQRKAVLA